MATPDSVGPYRIVKKLGSGGMGEVYLAEDTRLGRQVALKSLSERWAQAPDARRRLVHEARAAAGLNQNNIAAVYDVVETADASWIVMEYAPGESLAEALRRGPLPPEAVVWVGVQLCDALTAAHARGIIHRDLKPANLVLSPDGHLKVLDFGLAKSLDLDTGAFTHSRPGIDFSVGGRLVGTLPYLPPEHILGEPVDERSDLYTAGVVLFELLTGRRPFDGPDKKTIAQAIVDGRAPDLAALRPELPDELVRVVRRAMTREPGDRPPTAGALRAELEQLSGAQSGWKTLTDLGRPFGLRIGSGLSRRGRRRRRLILAGAAVAVIGLLGLAAALWIKRPGESPPHPPVIAVLPLSNVSGDIAYDHLVIGFADVIVSALAGLPGVNVVSRSAVMEAREDGKQPSRLARRLGADLLVDGSVQRSANQVRVALNVVRAGTNVVSWSRVFEGADDDILKLQKTVAEAVAEAVKGGVSARDLERIERAIPPISAEVLSKYGAARKLLDRTDVSGNVDQAIALFEEALAKEPRFALAEAGLAEAYWASYVFTKEARYADLSRGALDRALALDPDQPQVRLLLAEHLGKRGQAGEAMEQLGRVIRLQPTSDDAHRSLGELLIEQGKIEEGLAELHRAVALRPEFWQNLDALGIAYFELGRYGEAAAVWKRVTEVLPDSSWGYLTLGAAQQATGDKKGAEANYRKSIEHDPSRQGWSNLGTLLYAEGRYEDARRAFEEALRLVPNSATGHRNLGDVLGRLGDSKGARRQYLKAADLAREDVRVTPGDGMAHARLAVYEAKAGRRAEALVHLEAALRLSPESVEVLYRKAVVYALTGKQAEAREALDQAIGRGFSRTLAAEDEDVAALLPGAGPAAPVPATRR